MIPEVYSNIQIIAEQMQIIADNIKNLEQPSVVWNTGSVFLGAVIAAFVSWLTTKKQINYQVQEKLQKDKERRTRLAVMLISELEILKRFIFDRCSGLKAATSEGLIVAIYIGEKYFNIFDSNSDNVGIFDEKCSQKIIEAYMETKSLYDSARTLSSITSQLEKIKVQNCMNITDSNKHDLIDQLYQNNLHTYNMYSLNIQQQAERVMGLIDNSLLLLEKEKNS